MRYVKRILPDVIFNLLGLLALGSYLIVIGLEGKYIVLPVLLWGLAFVIGHRVKYKLMMGRFEQVRKTLKALDKKYLITEVIRPADEMYEVFYLEVLRQAEKCMLEEIGQIRRLYGDYKEYIEQWVHEIKGPLTVLKLKAENDTDGQLEKVQTEILQIENLVEQVLFYARSEHVEQDFVVRQMNLKECVQDVIVKNKYILRQNMSVELDVAEDIYVFSDAKWLSFVLAQIILNAVQYRKPDDGQLLISLTGDKDVLWLDIVDNGVGISDSDLLRVFDKGFTGDNGRSGGRSTGLGLYLCQTLCGKLGHQIKVSSAAGKGTSVSIGFSVESKSYKVVSQL